MCLYVSTVLWLGSEFQLDSVDIRQVSLMSLAVNVVDTARHPGVTVDSRWPIKSPRCAASPTADDHEVAVNRRYESGGRSVHHVPSGLLQTKDMDLTAPAGRPSERHCVMRYINTRLLLLLLLQFASVPHH